MKHIIKGDEPEAFHDWKALANKDWQPTYDNLRGDEKKAVKKNLMVEQGHICCYCERELLDYDSHIEHLRPQSDPEVDSLDYSNMVCSCQDQVKKGDPRHCGNLKDNWFDNDLFISPFDENCENNFTYTHDGKIQVLPQDNNAAQQTIIKLGLNIPKLNALREKAIEPFLDEDLDADDVARFVSGYLEKDAQGRFGEFWTTINCLFGIPVTV